MPGNPKAVQDSFATGVVAPEMSARVGLARYANGLIEGKNCYPTKTGALIRRRGTKFVALTKDSGLITDASTVSADTVRLLNFDFNEEQTHFIEAGDLYARFGADGGLIVESIDNGTSIVVSGTYEWILRSDSTYYLKDVGSVSLTGVTQPAKVWEQVLTTAVEMTPVSVPGPPSVVGEWTWGDFNALGFDTVYVVLSDSVDPDTKSDGDVVAVNYAEVTWPYLEAQLFDIDTTQSADVMWAVHPSHPPANVIRTESDVWQYKQIVFKSKHARPGLELFNISSGSGYTYNWHVSAEGYDGTEGLASEETWTQSATLSATPLGLFFGHDTISDYQYFPDGRDTIFAMDSVARFIIYRELGAEAVASGDPIGTPGFLAIVPSHDGTNGDKWAGSSDSYTMVDSGPTIGQFESASAIPAPPLFASEFVRIPSVGDAFSGLNGDGEGPDDILPRFVFTMNRIDTTHFRLTYVPVLDDDGNPEPWSRTGLVDTSNWIISTSSTDDPVYDIVIALQYTENGAVVPDYQDTPVQPNTLFSQSGDYPSAVTFFDQRLTYAATDNFPQEITMSRPGDFNNFLYRSIPADDDPIQKLVPARQANRVRNLVTLYDLVATTGGAIFRIWSESGVVSSRELQLRPQTERGASNLEPIAIFGTALYVSDKRNQVFLLSQRNNTFGYQDSELSIYAEHYFKGRTVVDWAYAAAPDSVLWVVMSDGKFLSFTYIPDQEVWAWAEHETDGWAESVTTIREGGVDAVYLAVLRSATGDLNPDTIIWRRRTIERMETEPADNLLTSVDVDCALVFEADEIPSVSIGIAFGAVKIVTVNPHGLVDDDIVFLDGLKSQRQSELNPAGQTVEEALNGRRFRVDVITSTNVHLLHVTDSSNVDGTGFLIDDRDMSFKAAVSTISGLNYYIDRPDNGDNIIIKHNGVDSATDTEKYQYLVEQDPPISASGVVTLTDPATHFMIGFGYDSEATTTDFSTHQEGARQAQGRQTNPTEVLLRVHSTLGLEAATQVGAFRPMKAKENSGLGYDSIALEGSTYDSAQGIMRSALSGDGSVLLAGEWDGVGRISIKQAATEAVPFTLLAILEEVIHGG